MYQVNITKKNKRIESPFFFVGSDETYKTLSAAIVAARNWASENNIFDFDIEVSIISCL